MTERLRPRDVAILAEESPSSPMHNATVEIFDPGESGFDYACLVRLVQDRISFVPRYRQRVQPVPGRMANPVWVDDDHFDIGYHVRRSALPRPGSLDQLRDLVSRIVSRPLDRSRPLWEMYFIEGLADGQVAILSKSHQVLVDGIETVDLGQVLLDKSPEPKELGADGWRARSRPSPLSLMAEAARESITRPETAVDTVRSTTGAALRGVAVTARSTVRVVDALAKNAPKGKRGRDRRSDKANADQGAVRHLDRHGKNTSSVLSAKLAERFPDHWQGYLDGKYKSVHAVIAGVTVPTGRTGKLMAVYQHSSAKIEGWALGYQYDLSKRTNLYADIDSKRFSVSSGTAPTSLTGFSAGINHLF